MGRAGKNPAGLLASGSSDAPRLPVLPQWLSLRQATFVPGYSGGPAAVLHGIPLTESEAIIFPAMIELIIGGARSGKSSHAERQALESHAGGLAVTYIATGEARDEEMAQRIAHHRSRRPAAWRTVEEPLALSDALRREAAPDTCLLVDCLTLWLTNVLLAERDAEIAALLAALPELPGRVILVSNEVGWGIVPENALARRFRDEQGRLNQHVAALADNVTLVAAGLPLVLKSSG